MSPPSTCWTPSPASWRHGASAWALRPCTTMCAADCDAPKCWTTSAPASSSQRSTPLGTRSSLLTEQYLLCRREGLQLLRTDLGILEPQRSQRLDDRGGDDQASEPLVVGRYDVPGRMLRRGIADHVLVGLHVVVPVLALLDVAGRELPVLFGVLEPFQKALLLLLPGDVQEELTDDDAVARRIALEAPDVTEPSLPDVLGDDVRRQPLALEKLGMHADGERLLV